MFFFWPSGCLSASLCEVQGSHVRFLDNSFCVEFVKFCLFKACLFIRFSFCIVNYVLAAPFLKSAEDRVNLVDQRSLALSYDHD